MQQHNNTSWTFTEKIIVGCHNRLFWHFVGRLRRSGHLFRRMTGTQLLLNLTAKNYMHQSIDSVISLCYTLSRFWKTNRVCKSFSKQFTYGPPDRGGPGYRHLMCRSSGLWPYGQPGPLPIGNLDCLIDWVKSSNFISWFLYNHEIARFGVQTCETVNKE